VNKTMVTTQDTSTRRRRRLGRGSEPSAVTVEVASEGEDTMLESPT
jgi:hypothetical protein